MDEEHINMQYFKDGLWKYAIGEVLEMGRYNIMIITATREDRCVGGVQRFYTVQHILKSSLSGIGVTNPPMLIQDMVLDEMVKMAKSD